MGLAVGKRAQDVGGSVYCSNWKGGNDLSANGGLPKWNWRGSMQNRKCLGIAGVGYDVEWSEVELIMPERDIEMIRWGMQ